MDIKNQVKLKFNGVDIVDVHFTSNERYDQNNKEKISLLIQPKVFYPKDKPKHFQILMELLLEAKDHFELKVFGIGSFDLNKNIDDDIKKVFVNTNAPAIMFPYMRSFISTFTSTLGSPVSSINIPPQFFSGNLEEAKENNK